MGPIVAGRCGIVPIVLYCGEWEGREVVPPNWEGRAKSPSHCPGFGRGFKAELGLPLAVLGVRINWKVRFAVWESSYWLGGLDVP